MFSYWGIPEELLLGKKNTKKKKRLGFIGQGFKAFLARYNFYCIITSPQYPEAKAETGRNVQTR